MDSDKEFEDSTLLDLPGVEEIGSSSSANINISKDSSEFSSVGKSAVKPSGSGFTFFLNSSVEDDSDDDQNIDKYSVEDSLQNLSVSNKVIQKTLKRAHEENTEGNDLQKELTERYISGQLSFNDYIRQIGSDDEDEENEGRDESDSDEDEEWSPSGSGSSSKPGTAKKRSQDKASMEEFSDELQRTAKQQLGKKLPRLGNPRGGKRKKLDPTLQGLMGEANLRFARGMYTKF